MMMHCVGRQQPPAQTLLTESRRRRNLQQAPFSRAAPPAGRHSDYPWRTIMATACAAVFCQKRYQCRLNHAAARTELTASWYGGRLTMHASTSFCIKHDVSTARCEHGYTNRIVKAAPSSSHLVIRARRVVVVHTLSVHQLPRIERFQLSRLRLIQFRRCSKSTSSNIGVSGK